MSCVSTVSTSIVVNGGALDQILPSRGLRQGDPLSPYLFILCMDFLGQFIEEKCSTNKWNPVRANRSGVAFSHLFFADDLVLFAKADSENCAAIREVLDLFCSKSGQFVSGAKSRVYFSPNIDRESREDFCTILGFQSNPNLGKYLGIPIKHPGSSSQDFNFVLDRVKQKLAGWKANLLSLAGRTVLVRHVSSTIPNYVMQCAHLSNKINEGIDRVNRNFLWGSTDSKRKMHWVGWEKVTKPKDERGLGIQSAKGRNLALLSKLNWRFHTEGESLWAKVLKGKYCNTRRLSSRNRDKLPCSRVWTAMKKGSVVFQKGVRWTCGRDSNLNFWHNDWSNFGTLRQKIYGPMTMETANLRVKEVVSASGWNWPATSFEFPDFIKQELQAMPFALASRGEDKLTWKDSEHGIFNLGLAYKTATSQGNMNSFRGKWIWKARILPRIQSFVWLCYHESIGVKECLIRRGMLADSQCPLCLGSSVSILHALRDCEVVKQVWFQLGVNQDSNSFFSINLQDWLEVNGTLQRNVDRYAMSWSIIFLFAIWLIWKQRNQLVFKGQRPNSCLAKDISRRALEFHFIASPYKEVITRVCLLVRWSKPGCGWVKLNTDGSSLGNPGVAGGGGLIRDEEGKWIAGFARKIGLTTSFMAELWALRDGLNVCLNYNFAAVEVELDAKAIVEAIANPCYSNMFASALMEDCKVLASRIPQVRFRHCYHESNRCADALARMGGSLATDFVFLACPPVDLVKFLDFDDLGLYLIRHCFEPLCSS